MSQGLINLDLMPAQAMATGSLSVLVLTPADYGGCTELGLREPWGVAAPYDRVPPSQLPRRAWDELWYQADGGTGLGGRLREARWLPRAAIRHWVRVSPVARGRLHELVTAELARQAGYAGARDPGDEFHCLTRVSTFRLAWDRQHPEREQWADNPEVVVLAVTRVERAADEATYGHV